MRLSVSPAQQRNPSWVEAVRATAFLGLRSPVTTQAEGSHGAGARREKHIPERGGSWALAAGLDHLALRSDRRFRRGALRCAPGICSPLRVLELPKRCLHGTLLGCRARLLPLAWSKAMGDGSRRARLPRIDWKGDQCLYLPCDREALHGHDAWRTQHPGIIWDASSDITLYLRVLYDLLHWRDYTGTRGT